MVMDFRFITADERETLYNEVWAEPVITVAKRYNLSDNGLRKHCKRLEIPLPSAGYWARIRAGQKVDKPTLPKVTGELRKHVSNYVIKYKADIKKLSDADLMADQELHLLSDETINFIKETCSKIVVKSQLREPDRLITEHKEEIIYRKKRDKKLNRASFNSNYYANVKSKYRDNKAILPISVSESNINRAYRIIDAIIKTIEEMEGHTSVETQSGKDEAYFIVLHTAFYFEIKEEIKKGKKANDNDSILLLAMTAKSWFSFGNKSDSIQMKYKDTNNEPLEEQLGKIVYQIFVIADKYMAIDEMQDREYERRLREEERKRRLELMRKGELSEVKLLEQAVSEWDKAEKIRRFTDQMELQLAEVNDDEKKDKILRWLKWARDKADWLDPLIEKEDELLGKSKHIFEVIITEVDEEDL
jgi:hypothetical protein